MITLFWPTHWYPIKSSQKIQNTLSHWSACSGLRPWLGRFCSVAWVFLFLIVPVQAMIFYSTGDPNFNTTAPANSLANSGWQWVGNFDGYQGTPIGPHHFLSARHIGGTVGDPFILNGITYTTTAYFDDTLSDLRIWQVGEIFPSWAPLYRASTEVGKTLMVFGRGRTRGAAVNTAISVAGVPAGTLAGWQWNTVGDGRLRWGQNTVRSTINGGSYWGALLYATFDAAGGVDEAHLATGDSSGPVFINDGTNWKLAGIAAVVDAAFSTAGGADAGFNAAIFDTRGLYFGSSGNWTLESGAAPIPSGFYATRVSARATWIDSVAPATDDASDAPLLSPVGDWVFAVLLFGVGAFFLRRHRDPIPSVA